MAGPPYLLSEMTEAILRVQCGGCDGYCKAEAVSWDEWSQLDLCWNCIPIVREQQQAAGKICFQWEPTGTRPEACKCPEHKEVP